MTNQKPALAVSGTVSSFTMDEKTADRLTLLRTRVESVFRGKRQAVELVLVALLARGHVLLEDVPGVGKTTLARALAGSLDLHFQRIQFTSDLLPADVVGVSVYSETRQNFEFRPGPIFANIVLADEINRTTPRTQSSLLEAMNERQVTVDNQTFPLKEPFMVLATQNPLEFSGTYPLPESQLDRFLLRLSLGYPDRTAEVDILRSYGHVDPCADLTPVLSRDEVLKLQEQASAILVSDEVVHYLLDIVERTRKSPQLELGASTRGAMALYRGIQARALLLGRAYAVPQDVKSLCTAVLAHRVMVKDHGDGGISAHRRAEAILEELLDRTPVPL